MARANALRLGFARRAAFAGGDWGEGLRERFDLILANPPYVEDGADLAADVRDHEPAGALFAGPDGLDAYRMLVPQLPGLLNPGGVRGRRDRIGAGRGGRRAGRGGGAGERGRRDLAGRDRCLVMRRASAVATLHDPA